MVNYLRWLSKLDQEISATIGGGQNNTAWSSGTVSGGSMNSAGGIFGTVSGGNANLATGSYSSVLGGNGTPLPLTTLLFWVALKTKRKGIIHRL